MTIAKTKAVRFLVLSLLCVAAAVLNSLFTFLTFDILRIPLFVDTVFTAAVVFSAGLIPGLAVALIHWALWGMVFDASPFVIVGIVEVFIIWLLRPVGTPWPVAGSARRKGLRRNGERLRDAYVAVHCGQRFGERPWRGDRLCFTRRLQTDRPGSCFRPRFSRRRDPPVGDRRSFALSHQYY